MYVYNGQPFDITLPQLVGDNQYPPGWFFDAEQRAACGIIEVADPVAPATTSTQVASLIEFRFINGSWTPRWQVVEKTPEQLAQDAQALSDQRTAKNDQINAWRAEANLSTFPHAGKQIACDALSRSDIDGVANNIALSGGFPSGFPMAWKATDNTFIQLADVDAFKAMYASMTAQGTENFNHAQALKARLAAASSPEEIAAIAW
jgi:hypothetical protein